MVLLFFVARVGFSGKKLVSTRVFGWTIVIDFVASYPRDSREKLWCKSVAY